ncbi:MAG TPA: FAD-dependent oxidoreductase, partial [Aliiroseovarius sp.]|nr:FAD-dependent oxidoreductase [Aliiroseovarius sp.]
MSAHIAIIGAGIVGVSTAVWLQRAGYDVTLIEREQAAGEAASYGNAGVLASSAIVPLSVPGLLRKAPKMLLDRDEPLFLKWSYLPRLSPWLHRFLQHANAQEAQRITAGLAALISDSLADHQALAQGTGAERWLHASDYLYLYRSRAEFDAEGFEWALRRQHGFAWDEMEGMGFRTFDPVFSPEMGFAIRMGNHGRISDPGAYVKALAAHVVAQGGRIMRAEVSDIVRENGRVIGLRASGETLPCDATVLAGGAWAQDLARRMGVRVPLETERGYHLELIEPSFMPRAPVMIAAGKFVITPMEGRLRLAGIVEFGGLSAPPS